jgi:hypothetical protein
LGLFTQNAGCTHTITYAATWITYYGTEIALPSWMTFTASTNTANDNNLSITTADVNNVDTSTHTYTVRVTGTISTSDNNAVVTANSDVVVTVTNPCMANTPLITSQTLTDITYWIENPTNTAIKETFSDFADSVSTTYSGTDLCGPKDMQVYYLDQLTPYSVDGVPYMTVDVPAAIYG